MPENSDNKMNPTRRKIAIVNQRFGPQVNGGSEVYARELAINLKKHLRDKDGNPYEVEIITTCARDYDTWENYYEAGVAEFEGVIVRRFIVDGTRESHHFLWVDRIRRYMPFLGKMIEKEWIKAQGPYCPGAIKYIEEHQDEYEKFIFVTYLYYLTAMGLPKVADKAILVPTAHDEPMIYMKYYRDIFTKPSGIIYLTDEEKEFAQATFHNENIPSTVAAMGIDVCENVDSEAFRHKYGLREDYLIYVGRIDEAKGCKELFDYFLRYKKEKNISNLKLVLMGKSVIEIPKDESIVYLGFVSEQDKCDGIVGARALILPSEYESLSISVLEAMKLGVPVVVNGKCKVLKGHCEKSKAGVYYTDYDTFKNKLDYLMNNKNKYDIMSSGGQKYVNDNYNWETIIERISRLI